MTREFLNNAYEAGSAASSLVWPAVSALARLPNIVAAPAVFAAGIAAGLHDACRDPTPATEEAAAAVMEEAILPLDLGDELIAMVEQDQPELFQEEQDRYLAAQVKWHDILSQCHQVDDLVHALKTDPRLAKNITLLYGALSDHMATASAAHPEWHANMKEIASSLYALQEIAEKDILSTTYLLAQSIGKSIGIQSLVLAEQLVSQAAVAHVRQGTKQASGYGAALTHAFLRATIACKDSTATCWASLATGLQIGATEAMTSKEAAPPTWQPMDGEDLLELLRNEQNYNTKLAENTGTAVFAARDVAISSAPDIVSASDSLVTGINIATAITADVLFYAGRVVGNGAVHAAKAATDKMFTHSADDFAAKEALVETREYLRAKACPAVGALDTSKQRDI